MTPLDARFDPPAAVISVALQNPSAPNRKTALHGIIDTGADVTAIPASLIHRLGLRVRSSIRLSGVERQTIRYPTYLINLELADTRIERRAVIAWNGDEVILGRDVLSEFVFVYDGKTRQFEIHDP